jgi:hypothetical protein
MNKKKTKNKDDGVGNRRRFERKNLSNKRTGMEGKRFQMADKKKKQ